MHMIITLVILQAWFIVVFKDLSVGSIDDMATIRSKDTMVFEGKSSLWKRRSELIKKVFKGGKRDLIATLDKCRLRRDPVRIQIKVFHDFVRSRTLSHGKDQFHRIREREFSGVLPHKIVTWPGRKKPMAG